MPCSLPKGVLFSTFLNVRKSLLSFIQNQPAKNTRRCFRSHHPVRVLLIACERLAITHGSQTSCVSLCPSCLGEHRLPAAVPDQVGLGWFLPGLLEGTRCYEVSGGSNAQIWGPH